jgi:aldehyde dehydrogenase (NAD+)
MEHQFDTASLPEISHANQFYIDGEWVEPSSSAKIDVYSASTEQVISQVAEAQVKDVERAVRAARDSFDNGPWARMSPEERAPYLHAIGQEMRERSAKFAAMWVAEMGITYAAAQAQCDAFGNVFDYYANLAADFPFVERHTPSAGDVGYIVREPVGVVAAIIPWNAPVSLMTYKVAPALIAGCSIIIKGSPEAPSAPLMFAEIADKVGLPAGVINALTADREVSEALVRNPGVDKVSFTGSTAAGRKIASICGERIARVTLELGGKSAAVILDDYDIETAANSISGMATLMTGQVCSSLTRIVVPRKRHDQMVDALSYAFSKVCVGDPFDSATQMGPLAMARQLERVEMLVDTAKSEGARLAIGGKRPANLNRGHYFEPTVFGNVDNKMTIAREEIFGPVLSVIPVDTEDEAIDVANDTIYGLNASVFTNDVGRAFDVARRLRSGTVGQNSFRTDFGIAFGGFKQSGIGREGGREGLYPYLEAKTIVLDQEVAGLSVHDSRGQPKSEALHEKARDFG